MNAQFWKWLVIATLSAFAFTLLSDGLAQAQNIPDGHKGYYSRACGFDLDDDGVAGEASDCDICDGNQSTGAFTADPDGDGVAEDLYWVDCNSGSDAVSGVNTPTTPFRTINRALSQLNGTGSNKEDIICVRSTCAAYNGSQHAGNASGNQINASGVASTPRTKTAAGSENFNFNYPTNPFMLVAWDTDQDGQYPPYDSTQPEPFILDACGTANCTTATAQYGLNIGNGDDVEIAHITIKNYARGMSVSDPYAIGWLASGASPRERHYAHDIEIDSALRGTTGGSEPKQVRYSMQTDDYARYLAFENVKVANGSGWLFRGFFGKPSGGALLSGGAYVRMRNHTYTEPDVGWMVIGNDLLPGKTWQVDYIEIIDSKWDFSMTEKPLGVSGERKSQGVVLNKGSEYLYIRGNEFIDVSTPMQFAQKDDDAYGKHKNGHMDGNTILYTQNGPHTMKCRTVANIGQQCTSSANCGGGVCEVALGPVEPAFINMQKVDGVERGEEPCDDTITNGEEIDCNCDQPGGPYFFGDTYFTNNFIDFANVTNVRGVLKYQNGSNCTGNSAEAGTLTVANNTIKNFRPATKSSSRSAFQLGRPGLTGLSYDFNYVYGNIRFFNNIIEGDSGGYMIQNVKQGEQYYCPLSGPCYYDSTQFFADNNRYVANAIFVRQTTNYDLAGWKGITTEEANSKTYAAATSTTCQTVYQSDGLHLDSTDSCSRDTGNLDDCTDIDIDEDARPLNTQCDIGADEYVTVASQPGQIDWQSLSYTSSEGTATLAIYATRTNGTDGTAGANYATASGTATGAASCTGTADYVNASGTLSWGAGVGGTQTFNVTICDDTTPEAAEAFTITLSSPTGATLGANTVTTVTITDNDQAPLSAPNIDMASRKSACSTANGDTLTIPAMTIPSGAGYPSKILVVAAGAYSPNASWDHDCDFTDAGVTVTWNGHSLVLAGTTQGFGGNPGSYGVCSALYYWLGPEAGATSDVVIDLNETPATDIKSMNAAAVVLYNAAQEAPEVATWGSSFNAETPLSSDISVTRAQSVVVDAAVFSPLLGGGNVLPGVSQTELADVGSCWSSSWASHLGVSAKPVEEAGTATMGWSWASGTVAREAHVMAAFVSDVYSTDTTTTSTTSTSTTVTLPDCGDGNIDAGEDCDDNGAGADNLNGKKCSNFPPLAQGTLTCNADCTFNTSACTLNRRGGVSMKRVLEWCESFEDPQCNGTCPAGTTCVDAGTECECQ